MKYKILLVDNDLTFSNLIKAKINQHDIHKNIEYTHFVNPNNLGASFLLQENFDLILVSYTYPDVPYLTGDVVVARLESFGIPKTKIGFIGCVRPDNISFSDLPWYTKGSIECFSFVDKRIGRASSLKENLSLVLLVDDSAMVRRMSKKTILKAFCGMDEKQVVWRIL